MANEDPCRPIVVFGISGQLGIELGISLPALGRIVGLTRAEADLSRPESLRAIVRDIRPRILINAAAYTSVDLAESETELVQTVNAIAPRVLAEEARSVGACLIHYSSDYVFDGRREGAYVEGDAPNPLSVYGRSKLEGDKAVAGAGAAHVILRTSWVYSAYRANFVKTILRLAAERESLRVVGDQHGSPTSARLIARVTSQVVGAILRASSSAPPSGLYHVTAHGATTWHGFARYVIAQALDIGMPLRTTPEGVARITTAEYPTTAVRPFNSCLDTTRIRSELGLSLPDWREGVDSVIHQLSALPAG